MAGQPNRMHVKPGVLGSAKAKIPASLCHTSQRRKSTLNSTPLQWDNPDFKHFLLQASNVSMPV